MEYYVAKAACLELDSSYADKYPYLSEHLELFLPDKVESQLQCEKLTIKNFLEYDGGAFYKRAKGEGFGRKGGIDDTYHLTKGIRKLCSHVTRQDDVASAPFSCTNITDFHFEGHGSIVLSGEQGQNVNPKELYYSIRGNEVEVNDITRVPTNNPHHYTFNATLRIKASDTAAGKAQFEEHEWLYDTRKSVLPSGIEHRRNILYPGDPVRIEMSERSLYVMTPVTIACWNQSSQKSDYPILQFILGESVRFYTVPVFEEGLKTGAKEPDPERMGNISYSFKLPASFLGHISFTVEPVKN